MNNHKITLSIEGMSCASCVNHVETALKKVNGVKTASVNLATEKATVTSDAGIEAKVLIEAVEKAGYEAKEYIAESQQHDGHTHLEDPKNNPRWKVLGSAVLTLPLVAPMVGELFSIHLMPPIFLQIACATLVQFYFGFRFYRSSLRALKAKSANMDLLVTLGTSSAFGLSLYQVFVKNEIMSTYFESAAVVITLVLLGKWLEARAKVQTTAAIRALQSLRPERARVLRRGFEIDLALSKVEVGDIVIVRPGERIPVDGEILQGSSFIDESLITGESVPLSKQKGDRVIGGSINGDGLIQIETKVIGAQSVLSRIVELVENAQAAKAPIQRLVDKVSAIFVPVVFGISVITILAWGFLSGNWEHALVNGIAVMVIACPCALGLATPTAIMVGTGIAAKNGILIKDAEALERAHEITAIAFDKTGTLTEGKPQVTNLFSVGITEKELLTIAASLQNGSTHPLAHAVLTKATEAKITVAHTENLRAIPGRGVQGEMNQVSYFLGNQALMSELSLSQSDLKTKATQLENEGKTVSWIASQNNQGATLLGLIAFSDEPKVHAFETITELKKLKIKSLMLTGDNQGSAAKIAEKLKIDQFFSNILPGEKAALIQKLKEQYKVVAMVGDGINDAPALASAHIGFAMATGTDVAMKAAGITLMRGDPLLITDAIQISRRTFSKIKQNLFWAFIYNIIGIPLAALGFLNPMIAGGAMAFSSVSVVSNSLLLKRFKRKEPTS